MKNMKTLPNWKFGLPCGLAIGTGVGMASSNVLLGIAMAVSLGLALSYGHGPQQTKPSATPRP